MDTSLALVTQLLAGALQMVVARLMHLVDHSQQKPRQLCIRCGRQFLAHQHRQQLSDTQFINLQLQVHVSGLCQMA